MKGKEDDFKHSRFLKTEAMTVKFRGLSAEMIQHMARTESQTLSDWVRDAVRFRLRYDLRGDLSISDYLSLQPSIPKQDHKAQHDNGYSEVLDKILHISEQTESDLALVMRLLFQTQHFMRAGIGDLLYSNANLNIKGVDGQAVYDAGKALSHEFLKRARGNNVE